jgi:SAM-dependent methyltransferase
VEIEEYEIMYRAEETHWWYVSLRNVLACFWTKYVSIDCPRVVDVGCGTGATLAALSARHLDSRGTLPKKHLHPSHGACPRVIARSESRSRSARLLASDAAIYPCAHTSVLSEDVSASVGLDFMPEALRFCRRRDLDRLIAASATDLPLADESFDVALSFDVLCNKSIQDKRAPLREIRRVLRPGGLAFLNLPAYQWLHSSHDLHVHTDKRFTKGEAVRLARDCGLELLHATYWNTLLFPPIVVTRLWRKLFPPDGSDLATVPGEMANRVFGRVLSAELALLKRAPLPFGLSVFVAARKPE